MTNVDVPGSAHGAIDKVISLLTDSVDSALGAIPNPIPSGGQLRTSRARGRQSFAAGANRVRKPILAGIGAADWLAQRLAPPGG